MINAFTLWMTGLSGAGKSTIANELKLSLRNDGFETIVLDGDFLRNGLNRDLGFSREDRRENVRRTAELARLMNEEGLSVVAALISPYAEERQMAKDIIGSQRFLEVYVATSLAVCEKRDPKGLYRCARAGGISNFTGVNAPYEAPNTPDMTVNTENCSIVEVVSYIRQFCGH